ncbi:hypothetical protein CPC08DRAFT_764193 [Agrocybe pediades]|nr:hypothetical protein CPC08DRAFT_764193 [Agrocybe pediades]
MKVVTNQQDASHSRDITPRSLGSDTFGNESTTSVFRLSPSSRVPYPPASLPRRALTTHLLRHATRPKKTNDTTTRERKILDDRRCTRTQSALALSSLLVSVLHLFSLVSSAPLMDSDIKAHIQAQNNDYDDTGIQFRLVKTTRIKSKDWFENVYQGSPQEQAMKLLYNIGDASTLNVFNSITASLGTASIPFAYYRCPKSNGRMILRSEAHARGRPLSSTSEADVYLYILQGGCDDGVGDNIADTPPQASGSDGCPKWRDSCPGDGSDLISACFSPLSFLLP